MRGWIVGLCLRGGVALAGPADGLPVEVRVSLGADVDVDWSNLVLEVTASGTGFGTDSAVRAVEQRVRQALEGDVPQAARRVPVTATLRVGDLVGDEVIGPAVVQRADHWVVVENRYFASGRVELVAQLSLQDLLKAWLAGLPAPKPDPRSGGPSGLVLDARGLSFEPVYAPVVRGPDGELLFSGGMSAEAAAQASPVVYVSDPTHPAALRAGRAPAFARVARVQSGELVVEGPDVIAVRRVPRGHLGEGRVVVVVGP